MNKINLIIARYNENLDKRGNKFILIDNKKYIDLNTMKDLNKAKKYLNND